MSDSDLVIDTGSEQYKKAASGGGGGKPISKGVHEFIVNGVELKKSGNTGQHFLKLDLLLRGSKRRVFDNYLTLDQSKGQFKRTVSFLEALGLAGKINLPELVKSGELVGRPVQNKITSYTYTYDIDENGNPVRVSDWQDEFESLEASGRLSGDGVKVDADAGFYSRSDHLDEWFDNGGASSGDTDADPNAGVWG